MFGCGLPVCAASYACIGELVHDGSNGLLFSDAQQLARHLVLLLQGFPSRVGKLGEMRAHLRANPAPSWLSAWQEHVLPVFTQLLGQTSS